MTDELLEGVTLIELFPTQVVKYWNIIEFGLFEEAEPILAGDPNYLPNMLEAIIFGFLKCWFVMKGGKLALVMLTSKVYDPSGIGRTLFIQHMYIHKQIPIRDWKVALLSLYKYAKRENCLYISGRTYNETIVKVAEELGGKTMKLIVFDIRR